VDIQGFADPGRGRISARFADVAGNILPMMMCRSQVNHLVYGKCEGTVLYEINSGMPGAAA
jgi:hypothetical protein